MSSDSVLLTFFMQSRKVVSVSIRYQQRWYQATEIKYMTHEEGGKAESGTYLDTFCH